MQIITTNGEVGLKLYAMYRENKQNKEFGCWTQACGASDIAKRCWKKRKTQPQDILLTFHQKLARPKLENMAISSLNILYIDLALHLVNANELCL